jgi:hypothetical protein
MKIRSEIFTHNGPQRRTMVRYKARLPVIFHWCGGELSSFGAVGSFDGRYLIGQAHVNPREPLPENVGEIDWRC